MPEIRAQEAPSILDLSVISSGAGISARCEFTGYEPECGYTMDLYLNQVEEDGTVNEIALKGILPTDGGAGTEMTQEKAVEPGIYKATLVMDRTDGGGFQVDNFRNSQLYDVAKGDEGYVVTPRQEEEKDPGADENPPAELPAPEGAGNQAAMDRKDVHQVEIFQDEGLSENGNANTAAVNIEGEHCFCNHTAEYRIVREADPDQDALLAGECIECGEVISYSFVANSAYAAFLEATVDMIRSAQAEEEIVIETERWISFNQAVFDAMEERPEVTVTVIYRYNGEKYQVTIPAGTGGNGLTDENGFCGFRYLDQVFGGKDINC